MLISLVLAAPQLGTGGGGAGGGGAGAGAGAGGGAGAGAGAAGAAAAGAAMMAAGTGMMMMNPMSMFPLVLAGASFAKVMYRLIAHFYYSFSRASCSPTLLVNLSTTMASMAMVITEDTMDPVIHTSNTSLTMDRSDSKRIKM